MKKTILIVLLVFLFVISFNHDNFLWCKKLFLSGPTTHKIQKGEYLSVIAKKYYGKANYWRELALINRAPDSDLVFPGEEIVIPSLKTIKEVHRTRWLSKVNSVVKQDEEIIAHASQIKEKIEYAETLPDSTLKVTITTEKPKPVETESFVEPLPTQRASFQKIILVSIIFILLLSIVSFVIYKQRKKQGPIIVDDNNSQLDDDMNITDE